MIILTQLKGEDGDDTTIQIRSRVFAPGLGIDEDPAVNSPLRGMVCILTPRPERLTLS